ncbi:MAG: Na/Pi cotransporter family protein [Pseudomonadota bacterium]
MLVFLLNIFGATMLLLYAVHLVQANVQHHFGPRLRVIATHGYSTIPMAFLGLVLAILFQSSVAVVALLARFFTSGHLGFAAGLAGTLGADLGSALVVQLLSFRLEWLIPLFLAIGGWLFLKTDRLRSIGKILLGIALILLALRFFRETAAPLGTHFSLFATYLENDVITAFLIGTLLSFVMHSSIAAILLCITMTTVGAIPLTVGIPLVLGANLGSALLCMWVTRTMGTPARRLALSNTLLRGLSAVVALSFIEMWRPYLLANTPGQTLINTHLVFNGILLLGLPFVRLFEQVSKSLIPEVPTRVDSLDNLNALHPDLTVTPKLALASVKRELMQMTQVVELMTRPLMELFEASDHTRIKQTIAMDRRINRFLSGIRRYVTRLPMQTFSQEERRRLQELTEYAISLEAAGDIIAKRLLPLAKKKVQSGICFSDDGWQELIQIHRHVLNNMTLAFDLLHTNDVAVARDVIQQKAHLSTLESQSRKKHLRRLHDGLKESFESSNLHLEILRGLRELNSQIATAAYPPLYQKDQLLETRLTKHDLEGCS